LIELGIHTIERPRSVKQSSKKRQPSFKSSGGGGGGGGVATATGGGGSSGGKLDKLEDSKGKGFSEVISPRTPLIGVVEIAWRGQVERTCFPLPFEIKYLSKSTKLRFLDEVDVSSSDKRMGALIKQCDFFIAEMDLIYTKAEQSPIYLFLHQSLTSFKVANYGLVVALNANMLLSKATVGSPFQTIIHHVQGDNSMNQFELARLVVVAVLLLLLLMYIYMCVCNLSVTLWCSICFCFSYL
jgi:hypothetical protein